jgi:hypothetical protein
VRKFLLTLMAATAALILTACYPAYDVGAFERGQFLCRSMNTHLGTVEWTDYKNKWRARCSDGTVIEFKL